MVKYEFGGEQPRVSTHKSDDRPGKPERDERDSMAQISEASDEIRGAMTDEQHISEFNRLLNILLGRFQDPKNLGSDPEAIAAFLESHGINGLKSEAARLQNLIRIYRLANDPQRYKTAP